MHLVCAPPEGNLGGAVSCGFELGWTRSSSRRGAGRGVVIETLTRAAPPREPVALVRTAELMSRSVGNSCCSLGT